MPASPANIRELWPLLVVTDIGRSLAFYRDALGFDVVQEALHDGQVYWCRLARGGSSLMLQQATEEDGPAAGRGRGVTLYFVCDDARALYEEFTTRGLVLEPPTVAPYGMKQLFVPEPDGYPLCFESPTELA